MSLSPSEQAMWEVLEQTPREKVSDHEIEEKYEQGEQRIVTEVNREKLPNFVQSLNKPDHINVRPFYQRRLRWDLKRQSRLLIGKLTDRKIDFQPSIQVRIANSRECGQRSSNIRANRLLDARTVS